MHLISYRSKLFLGLKYAILVTLGLQICLICYLVTDLSSISQWLNTRVLAKRGLSPMMSTTTATVDNVTVGLMATCVGFMLQQMLGLYGIYMEILGLAIVYTVLTAVQTIVWLVLAIEESVLALPFVGTALLTTGLSVYCYLIPRDGGGGGGNTANIGGGRKKSTDLVKSFFGSQQQLADDLYVTYESMTTTTTAGADDRQYNPSSAVVSVVDINMINETNSTGSIGCPDNWDQPSNNNNNNTNGKPYRQHREFENSTYIKF